MKVVRLVTAAGREHIQRYVMDIILVELEEAMGYQHVLGAVVGQGLVEVKAHVQKAYVHQEVITTAERAAVNHVHLGIRTAKRDRHRRRNVIVMINLVHGQ